MLRAATDADPAVTILSLDGIGAYDHIFRAAMLERLEKMPKARVILPFVRLSNVTPSNYSWWDAKGERHTVTQAEGGEQGDPLMTLLYSIDIQAALEEVATTLEPRDQLCAFLDDVYALCQPSRVKDIHDALATSLFRVAGIRLYHGNTKVWNKGGVPPENVDSLGEEAWQPTCVMVLGTPIESAPFVAEKLQSKITDERRLWEAIPDIPDLQCAWQVLLQSANPRANHTLRTLPPALSLEYSRLHGEGIWGSALVLIGQLLGTEGDVEHAKQVASLPMRMGGLGLRSATRGAVAAYWVSWCTRVAHGGSTQSCSCGEGRGGLVGAGRATRRVFGPPPRGVSNLGTPRIHRDAQLGRETTHA